MGKSLANLLIQNSQWPGFWRHCSLVHAKTTQIQSVFSACRPIMLLSCWLSPCRHQMWLTINTCYYYTRLTASFPGQRGWAGTRKAKTSLDLNESRASRIVRDDGVLGAMASAGPSANNLQITTSIPHHSFLQAGCSCWHQTNSVKAPKANGLQSCK